MGSGSSKPSVETSTPSNLPQPVESGGGCPVRHGGNNAFVPSTQTAAPSNDDRPAQQSDAAASSESKCPMHNADGTYSFNWRALFRSNFPHKPSGETPLSESEARAKITRRASVQDGTLASPGGGCPVTEYNVYSQPLDPKNNMPRMANQLPAPQQSKALSTERVQSSIPKVCAKMKNDNERKSNVPVT